MFSDSTHTIPLWLLPSVAAPVGSSIIVTHGEILLNVTDDTATCAVLRAMQIKFVSPRPVNAERLLDRLRPYSRLPHSGTRRMTAEGATVCKYDQCVTYRFHPARGQFGIAGGSRTRRDAKAALVELRHL